MSPATEVEVWAPLPGWGGGYEVELHSGRCRSVDRYNVNTLGQRMMLRGVELRQCGRSKVVTLSHRGARRTFTPAKLVELAAASS
ncbi:Uncharacterised protein [Mycobacteroides abscessus subsp. abscessus]|uniref:hypothetical protein n=1 Tax=Mycobacteroides abscessus TaxID=36809 RepID=UPI00092A1BA8|nr:hypothetical protein [Mycobacteroides abscessus]SHZ99975.1 Uncharacterised protein [Mycobacteroides abscessus subsp. abscessus]SIA00256.1 Uncharacterised protein [Mycobacteroides abscessus subsp. abscessus]